MPKGGPVVPQAEHTWRYVEECTFPVVNEHSKYENMEWIWLKELTCVWWGSCGRAPSRPRSCCLYVNHGNCSKTNNLINITSVTNVANSSQVPCSLLKTSILFKNILKLATTSTQPLTDTYALVMQHYQLPSQDLMQQFRILAPLPVNNSASEATWTPG